MQYEVSQLIVKIFFILTVFSLVAANARPPHFGDTNQAISQDAGQEAVSNLVDPGLKPWQMDLLVQRMGELNQLSNQLNGQDFNFDRTLRSGNEIKRQSRYRLCYFNPVSCFKK
ncbi:uncharacterized protein LOC132699757 [Cylas formicarius]|uniref:uncharacterized protein LOC132699757 n=1 Tax=Cylas formicarius TaxID=197179 RepID=UPI002958BDD8|nr:uncharacterized protein LOC132699757 [Cylas formicarius]